MRLVVSKSGRSLIYNREVLKISTVISYMGGLVGAVVALLFIVKSYTDTSLELNVSLEIFEDTHTSTAMISIDE